MEAKFEKGDILRYSDGPTALMKVTTISLNHGGHNRYYGEQFYGGTIGVYEMDARKASIEDIEYFEKVRRHGNQK